jgi:Xaa-Pro aminopeptidase
MKLGADGLAFDTIVASGGSASQPHYVPTQKHLEDNTALLIDMGVRVGGYNGDFSRTILLGKVSDEVRTVYTAVQEANDVCKKACVAGVTGKKLYELQESIYEKYDLVPRMPHSFGHGLGLEVHEAPLLRPNDQALQKNMVVTIEPGYYVEGKFGVRIEDVVVIK